MSATIKHLDPTAVDLEITISAAEFAQAEEDAFRHLARKARIPGVRPGKAPRRVFEAQYGHQTIHEKALEHVVPEAYSRAIREHELDPIDRPQLELLPRDGEESDLCVRATVAVRPTIALGSYKGIEIAAVRRDVEEDEVDRTLEALRKDMATLVAVERPIASGDVPTLDFEGTIDGVPFEGGTATDQPTEIVEERFIPGFARGIIGMSAGETKEIEAEFPTEYPREDLAGKKTLFTVTVREVKAPELPELNDEFATRFRPDASLADLRVDLRTGLEAAALERARRAMGVELMQKLAERHDVPLPVVLIERETEVQLEEAKAEAARAQASWDEYLRAQGSDEERFLAERRVESERRVKATLLLDAIAKAEEITATAEDIDAELNVLARQYGQPKERILELVQPRFGPLVDGIVRKKTIEFLTDAASVVASPATPQAGSESVRT